MNTGKYKHLREQTEQRRHQLVENKELYEYFRVAEQVEKWIKEQEVIASSEDYGTDLEHVQVGGVDYYRLTGTY